MKAWGVVFAGVVAAVLTGARPGHASVPVSCMYDSSSATVTVTLTGAAHDALSTSGGAITSNNVACGAATVTNTDAINVSGDADAQSLEIDPVTSFAPGKTTEPSGASEIEIYIDLGLGSDSVRLGGSAGPDSIRLGDLGANVNGDDDADVTLTNAESVEVDGSFGADSIDASGGLGTGNPFPSNRSLLINGGGDNDTLVGGDANTTFIGGFGDDSEHGGGGQDTFDEGPAPDGSDDIVGGAGNAPDKVDYSNRFGPVAVSLDDVANDGETASGELDNVHSDVDVVFGGDGNDTISDPSGLYIRRDLEGGMGADTITGGTNDDQLYGCYPENSIPLAVLCPGDGGDTISGAGGNDDIWGGVGDDKEYGGDGLDTFYEGADPTANGADEIHGGPGLGDLVNYHGRSAPLTITMNDNLANDGASGEHDNVFTDVEDVTGGFSNNTITGNGSSNYISAFAGGKQVWNGLGGDDTLDAGNNTVGATLSGSIGNDHLWGGSGEDTLSGGAGLDSVLGGPGNDTILEDNVPTGTDDLYGGTGSDEVSYAGRTAAVTVSLDNVANDGDNATNEQDNVHSDIENVTGGAGNDSLTGSALPNTLSGNGGADTMTGGAGGDTLIPGLGNDTMDGGAGIDTASYMERTNGVVVTIDDNANDGDPKISEHDNVKETVERVQGGSGPDTLSGSFGANTLYGNGGNDTFVADSAADGSDQIYGGLGTDTMSYADRSGRVLVSLDDQANDGDPLAAGGAGEKDNVHSDVENITGGSGADVLHGDADNNVLKGNDGQDDLFGGLGADTIGGGGDIDTADYSERLTGVTVSLDGVRNDGGPGENDQVLGDVENLTGSGGPDTLVGDAGVNVLTGSAGNDTLLGGGLGDTLQGSTGIDTADYSDHTAPVDVSIDGVANDGAAGEHDNVKTDVENLLGGRGDDTLTGSGGANSLDGGPGADVLDGGGGTDTADYSSRTAPVDVTLDGVANDGATGEGDNVALTVENVVGGSDDDHLTGSDGSNTLEGGPGNDALRGDDGGDALVGGEGNDFLDGGPGADLFNGGLGTDMVSYGTRTQPVHVSIDGLPNDGATGEFDNVQPSVENVTGGSANDLLVGSSSPNVLFGGEGDDTLYGDDKSVPGDPGDADTLRGERGNDRLYGRAGDDQLTGGDGDDYENGGAGDDVSHQGGAIDGDGADTLDGSTGTDTADYSQRFFRVQVTLDGSGGDGDPVSNENDNVLSSVENVLGGHGSDIIEGSGPVDNTIDGGAGVDQIKGWEGNDTLNGDEGADEIWGGSGNDQITGGTENDKLHGDQNNDTLDGGDGADFVDGNDDSDVLHGGNGNDVIHGGPDDFPGCGAVGCPDGQDQLFGDDGNDKLYGGGAEDDLTGGPGDDFENGEERSDTFHAGDDPGSDTFDGGTDGAYSSLLDTVTYAGRTENLTVTAGDNIANDGAAGENDNVKDNIEMVVGGSGDDTITGNGWGNHLEGGAGVDHLYGAGGNDWLVGGVGDDFLNGGPGNDDLGNASADPGRDTMNGDEDNDEFDAQDGFADTIDGGAGSGDTVRSKDDGLDTVTGVP